MTGLMWESPRALIVGPHTTSRRRRLRMCNYLRIKPSARFYGFYHSVSVHPRLLDEVTPNKVFLKAVYNTTAPPPPPAFPCIVAIVSQHAVLLHLAWALVQKIGTVISSCATHQVQCDAARWDGLRITLSFSWAWAGR